MYTFAIYLYAICAKIFALFNTKARTLVRGQKNTWKILEEKIGQDSYVWFHAASLGEFEQGRPLMERLKREHPEKKILLTFFSPSGYEVRKDYPYADVVCYLPFDTPLNARRFIRAARPEKAFFIKYEFWRNYIEVLVHHHIPVYSVSSIFRPNQVFFRWYGRGYGHCLRRISHFFVQNRDSEILLNKYGINRVTVAGDTRFARVRDIKEGAKPLPIVEAFVGRTKTEINETKRLEESQLPDAPKNPVLIAGSSWEPDENLLIKYFNEHPNLKLVLAPHVVSEAHIQDIISKLKRPYARYTQTDTERVKDADCLIIDCYRLLASIYRYATMAYVGGGFGVGIHNVPEAAVYGVPVIIGPNNKKFKEAQDLLKSGGCIEIHNQEGLDEALDVYLSSPVLLKKAGDAAHDYIKENAQAADIIYQATLK